MTGRAFHPEPLDGPPRSGALVVLNGASRTEVERASRLVRRLVAEPTCIAVDGGYRSCREAGLRPDLVVGDGDSIGRPPRIRTRTVRYPGDKDFSDFAGALTEARALGSALVVVAGLLGGRFDHEWANVLEAGRHAPGFAAILAAPGRGRLAITARGLRVRTVAGRTLSLFALGDDVRVTLRGTCWELDRERLEPGSHGLSNETRDRAELVVHRGTAMLVLP